MYYIRSITKKCLKSIKLLYYSNIIVLLSGCHSNNLVLMHPKGIIGLEERALILTAFGLMLIIVIPVIVMTLIFSAKYRASNTNNTQYNPNWNSSKKIEFVVWFIPIVIIVILSTLTWHSTHKLDPKKPIQSSIPPIIIDVIALDWKWLFIYPKQNIAAINELVFPVNVPIQFNVTSNSVMNSFFIPQLGSQIYAMAGMKSTLYLMANVPGKYKGISANFSGTGFSGMKFTVIATTNTTEFNKWIHNAQLSTNYIKNINAYEKIAKPSKFNTVIYFSQVHSNLFDDIINKFTHKHQTISKST